MAVFFDAFNLKGDYSEIMKPLEKLNPDYIQNSKATHIEICDILNVRLTEGDTDPVAPLEEDKANKIAHETKIGGSTLDVEDEVCWHAKPDGIIKIINEADFKLVICSADIPNHLKDRANINNFPIRILENVSVESVREAEQKAREANSFWAD